MQTQNPDANSLTTTHFKIYRDKKSQPTTNNRAEDLRAQNQHKLNNQNDKTHSVKENMRGEEHEIIIMRQLMKKMGRDQDS